MNTGIWSLRVTSLLFERNLKSNTLSDHNLDELVLKVNASVFIDFLKIVGIVADEYLSLVHDRLIREDFVCHWEA